jgi:hypothetical protein
LLGSSYRFTCKVAGFNKDKHTKENSVYLRIRKDRVEENQTIGKNKKKFAREKLNPFKHDTCLRADKKTFPKTFSKDSEHKTLFVTDNMI